MTSLGWRRGPLGIVLVYLAVAGLWIWFSDSAAAWLFRDTEALSRLQTVKGLSFVLVTAGLLYVLISRYVAALARLLEAERRARLEAQAAVRARDEFLALASHELRTPLTPLSLNIQIVKRHLPASGAEPLKQALDAAELALGRLSRLVDGLLDVARLSTGRMKLSLEEFDLAQLLRALLAGFSPDFAKAGCALTAAIDAPVAGRWDRLRLEQAAADLLANALKYGAGRPVEVGLRRVGERAVLSVRDHGIGIDPAAQAGLFQRFSRAAPIEHFGGLGLGLYMVRLIVEAHGGSIRLESAPGEGSAFTVELPLDAEDPRRG